MIWFLSIIFSLAYSGSLPYERTISGQSGGERKGASQGTILRRRKRLASFGQEAGVVIE